MALDLTRRKFIAALMAIPAAATLSGPLGKALARPLFDYDPASFEEYCFSTFLKTPDPSPDGRFWFTPRVDIERKDDQEVTQGVTDCEGGTMQQHWVSFKKPKDAPMPAMIIHGNAERAQLTKSSRPTVYIEDTKIEDAKEDIIWRAWGFHVSSPAEGLRFKIRIKE